MFNDFDERPDALFMLQRWYLGMCNGDWEHFHGVRLETLDNPGWSLKIDLSETSLENVTTELVKVERSNHDWVQWRVVEGRYEAACGPANLNEAVLAFLDVVDAESSPELDPFIRSRLRWHAGLESSPDTAGSISDSLTNRRPVGGAVALFIDLLQRVNIDLNDAMRPSPRSLRDLDPIPRDVSFAVARVTQMLDDAGLRDAAARVRVAWSAVLSGDVADLREQIKQDSD